MIKLGIFGDQSTNHQLLEQINRLPEVEIVGLYFTGNVVQATDLNVFFSPAGLMDVSDAILILTDKNISNDLVKLILRRTKPVYLQSVPNLHIKEIKELADLEKEAGVVTSIYNPFFYNPFLNPYINSYRKPFLLNLTTCFDNAIVKPSLELLLLVAAANRLAQSNFKKLDVFGINGVEQLVVNIRLEYDNGCLVNFTLTQENSKGSCEVFQKSGRTTNEFEGSLFRQSQKVGQEIDAISNFAQMVMGRDRKTNSFDGLMISVQIVHQINEHLRFNEIIF